jgi:ribonuclease HII
MSRRKKKSKELSPQQREALKRIAESRAEFIIGIDEVGMGCWAGPMAVAGVVVPKGWTHPEVTDSKHFKQKRDKMMRVLQEAVYPNILDKCLLSRPAHLLDEYGLEESQRHLTEGVAVMLRQRYPDALVVQDGFPIQVDGSLRRVIALPQADLHVKAVGAASILAKVSRDQYMIQQSEVYPGYGFETNVGYHSLTHKLALREHGPTPLHRRSYKPVQEIIRDRLFSEQNPPVPLTAPFAELVNS